ncbi:hypothetical protein MBH78_08575 [Oceanimonas sp. NS1]|nr:hypothetical protein [Oceanimonas sp. NS1]
MVTTQIAGIRLEKTFGWALFFMLTMLSALVLVMLFPGLALWLPERMGFVVGEW